MYAIAIDGPVGAGKSTVAKALSRRLGFIYVDTGALYRAIGYEAISRGIDPYDQQAVCELLKEISIGIEYVGKDQHVFVNACDVTDNIRTEKVSMAASAVSAYPEVRLFLLHLQRDFAKSLNVIMDGRDIGTVILPQADIKFFLTASGEERASRRVKDLSAKGIDADYGEVLADLTKRDYNDSHRSEAPLKVADDAIIVDTTDMDFDTVVEYMTGIIMEKLSL